MTIDNDKIHLVLKLAKQLIDKAPEQEQSVLKRLASISDEAALTLTDIASKIIAIAGPNIDAAIDDYLWLCSVMLEEEMYFRRHQKYRYTSFEEAYKNVYSNNAYMAKYMNGLLLSQLFWSNHSETIGFYRNVFLPMLTESSRHLEIGPGHGLLLAYACEHAAIKDIEAWDISPVSIKQTELAIQKMKIKRSPDLRVVDMFNVPATSRFDSIVFSEVLEHTEDPTSTMKAVISNLSSDGLLFLNMPINSPAPDHLFNLPAPEAVINFVEDSGLEVVQSHFAPVTNCSLERARKLKLTISCAVIAKKANS